ncbi:MAG: hypothetical protein DI537_17385 [Stutzerimonas stutzeri]|nr:MAG: hypothetical protein DI537_17385 [Stutzerimonas stutzeri]
MDGKDAEKTPSAAASQLSADDAAQAPSSAAAAAAAEAPAVTVQEGKRGKPGRKAKDTGGADAAKSAAMKEPAVEPSDEQVSSAKRSRRRAEQAVDESRASPSDSKKKQAPSRSMAAAGGSVQSTADDSAVVEAGPKRRGRKPKAASSEVAASVATEVAPAPKRRGRPPKAVAAGTGSVGTSATAPAPKQGERKARQAKAAGDVTASAEAPSDRSTSVNWAKVKVSPDIMVLSSGKTTTMQIGRKVWDAAGFAEDEAVVVDASGGDVRIAKGPKGKKPSSANGGVVVLKVPSIGEGSLWKIKYAVDGGSLLLHGQVAK